jgi:hypothetical protein
MIGNQGLKIFDGKITMVQHKKNATPMALHFQICLNVLMHQIFQ